jgi:DNA mismatch endonuclease (patch repair protein)
VTNAEFWAAKISGNRERDWRHDLALAQAGWAVMRVWEHESVDSMAESIRATVAAMRSS